MPLKHPTLVTDAHEVGPYFGMRERVRPAADKSRPLQPKYTHPQIVEAINRGPAIWTVWGSEHAEPIARDDGTGVSLVKRKFSPMPIYVSAYMQLLDGVHPTYELRGFVARGPRTQFPAITPATPAEVLAWREARGITFEEVSSAFDYAPGPDPRASTRKRSKPWREGDDFPNIRQHSVAKLGNDGVRWALLLLMNDEHPTLRVSRRAVPLQPKE